MKITLIQPYYFNIWEPLGLAYVGAYLKKHYSGKLEIDFYQGYFDPDDVIVNGARNSDIIGFSVTSPAFKHAVSLAKAIKTINPSSRIVFGGFHPSALPQACIDTGFVDHVVVGEGEKAFFEIALGRKDNIIYGKRLEELDDVLPDREIIRNDRTVDLCQKMVGKRIASFQSVRVCPFSCAFCSERVVTGKHDNVANPVRFRNEKLLLDEIECVSRKYALDYFKFVDATWNTSSKFVDKVKLFCEEKIRRGLKLPWEANVHASYATKEMLVMMKKAGCRLINVGCESGSQKILNDMKKGLTVEKIIKVFEWGRMAGLERRGYFLLGMPNETDEDVALTENLVDIIEPDIFGITVLCPYPGSDLYEHKRMKNWDWSITDEYSNTYWDTPHFSNSRLLETQKRLTVKFKDRLAWHNKVIEKE